MCHGFAQLIPFVLTDVLLFRFLFLFRFVLFRFVSSLQAVFSFRDMRSFQEQMQKHKLQDAFVGGGGAEGDASIRVFVSGVEPMWEVCTALGGRGSGLLIFGAF